jgi:hypothetical protein
MQSPFAKPLDRSFVDFFAKIGMQSPFAKPLKLLTDSINDSPNLVALFISPYSPSTFG